MSTATHSSSNMNAPSSLDERSKFLKRARRNERFRERFGLPTSEEVLHEYICQIKRTIHWNGTLYFSGNFVCFYSNVFGIRIKLKIHRTDIVSIDNVADGKRPAFCLVLKNGDSHVFLAPERKRDRIVSLLWALKAGTLSADRRDFRARSQIPQGVHHEQHNLSYETPSAHDNLASAVYTSDARPDLVRMGTMDPREPSQTNKYSSSYDPEEDLMHSLGAKSIPSISAPPISQSESLRQPSPLPRPQSPMPRQQSPLPRQQSPVPRQQSPLPVEQSSFTRQPSPLPHSIQQQSPLPSQQASFTRQPSPPAQQPHYAYESPMPMDDAKSSAASYSDDEEVEEEEEEPSELSTENTPRRVDLADHIDFGNAPPPRPHIADEPDMGKILEYELPISPKQFWADFLADDAPFSFHDAHERWGHSEIQLSAWNDFDAESTADTDVQLRDVRFVSPVEASLPMQATSTRVHCAQKVWWTDRGRVLMFLTHAINPDVPFGDYFHTVERWEVVEGDSGSCRVSIWVGVKFDKSSWSLRPLKSTITARIREGVAKNLGQWRQWASEFLQKPNQPRQHSQQRQPEERAQQQPQLEQHQQVHQQQEQPQPLRQHSADMPAESMRIQYPRSPRSPRSPLIVASSTPAPSPIPVVGNIDSRARNENLSLLSSSPSMTHFGSPREGPIPTDSIETAKPSLTAPLLAVPSTTSRSASTSRNSLTVPSVTGPALSKGSYVPPPMTMTQSCPFVSSPCWASASAAPISATISASSGGMSSSYVPRAPPLHPPPPPIAYPVEPTPSRISSASLYDSQSRDSWGVASIYASIFVLTLCYLFFPSKYSSGGSFFASWTTFFFTVLCTVMCGLGVGLYAELVRLRKEVAVLKQAQPGRPVEHGYSLLPQAPSDADKNREEAQPLLRKRE